jgi:hypothetical protein
VNDSGPRTKDKIKHVVVHDAEALHASGVAAFFAGNAKASTQLAVDESSCYRMLPDLVIPWGAPGVNTTGLHVEICGYAKWSRVEWLNHEQTLDRAAYKVAQWCVHYNIPIRWVGWVGLKLGRAGITTHAEASKAFRPGGHTDPGPNFPKDVFLLWVEDHAADIRGKVQV